jgi:hypothetical protein
MTGPEGTSSEQDNWEYNRKATGGKQVLKGLRNSIYNLSSLLVRAGVPGVKFYNSFKFARRA